MNITIRAVDARTYHVSIYEHIDENKGIEKPTLVHTANCLEIAGKHESNGNKFKICMQATSIAGLVIEEAEQHATISLFLHNLNVMLKYAYYKVNGDLSKTINHKFKEDRELLERILEGNQ